MNPQPRKTSQPKLNFQQILAHDSAWPTPNLRGNPLIALPFNNHQTRAVGKLDIKWVTTLSIRFGSQTSKPGDVPYTFEPPHTSAAHQSVTKLLNLKFSRTLKHDRAPTAAHHEQHQENLMADHTNNGNFGTPSLRLKLGLAEMLKGGVIMDVMNVEQARIAEEAGAISVMALERVPAMIRAEGGVARMANPKLIKEIMATVTIPVMAKARIGHFAEAQVLQEIGVDFIDESEVLTPADETYHIDKHAFTTPFVCGARNLGEALRRIAEGAAMIRTKGEPGTGDVVHAVQHMRQIVREIKALTVLGDEELYNAAKVHGAPYELVRMVAKSGKLPVPNFSAGGIATPADAALMMQLGAETVFVGSGIFMKERATPLDVEERTPQLGASHRSRLPRPGHRHRHHPLQRPQDRRRSQRSPSPEQ